jgi:hypothetical protein
MIFVIFFGGYNIVIIVHQFHPLQKSRSKTRRIKSHKIYSVSFNFER